jgi:hypothetical protein
LEDLQPERRSTAGGGFSLVMGIGDKPDLAAPAIANAKTLERKERPSFPS